MHYRERDDVVMGDYEYFSGKAKNKEAFIRDLKKSGKIQGGKLLSVVVDSQAGLGYPGEYTAKIFWPDFGDQQDQG